MKENVQFISTVSKVPTVLSADNTSPIHVRGTHDRNMFGKQKKTNQSRKERELSNCLHGEGWSFKTGGFCWSIFSHIKFTGDWKTQNGGWHEWLKCFNPVYSLQYTIYSFCVYYTFSLCVFLAGFGFSATNFRLKLVKFDLKHKLFNTCCVFLCSCLSLNSIFILLLLVILYVLKWF